MSKSKRAPEGVFLSIRELHMVTGFARDTVSARLQAAGVTPSAMRDRHPVYRLRDVLPVLYRGLGSDAPVDPERLAPFQRKAYYQAEREKYLAGDDCSRLVQIEDLKAERARVNGIFQFALKAIPAQLAAVARLSAGQVALIERECAKARAELLELVIEFERGGPAAA